MDSRHLAASGLIAILALSGIVGVMFYRRKLGEDRRIERGGRQRRK